MWPIELRGGWWWIRCAKWSYTAIAPTEAVSWKSNSRDDSSKKTRKQTYYQVFPHAYVGPEYAWVSNYTCNRPRDGVSKHNYLELHVYVPLSELDLNLPQSSDKHYVTWLTIQPTPKISTILCPIGPVGWASWMLRYMGTSILSPTSFDSKFWVRDFCWDHSPHRTTVWLYIWYHHCIRQEHQQTSWSEKKAKKEQLCPKDFDGYVVLSDILVCLYWLLLQLYSVFEDVETQVLSCRTEKDRAFRLNHRTAGSYM